MAQDIISKFLSALGRMSSRELHELAALLRSDSQRDAAIATITGAAGLRSGSAQPSQHGGTPQSTETPEVVPTAENHVHHKDVRTSFFALFRDKTCFADNDAIASAISEAFGINISIPKGR